MKAKPVNLKAIIFDCDGVILDSEYLFTQSMINYLTTQNVIVTLEDVKRYIGIPLDGIINMMIKDFSLRVSYDDIETYFNETAPLVKFYEDKGVLYKIDANGSIDEVWARLLEVID